MTAPSGPPWRRGAALAYLGLASAWTGFWAQCAPRSFYDHFPGLGVWVAGDGPYNEHLIRDVGGLHLGLAALTLLVRLAPGWVAAPAVGAAALVSATPHLVYHLGHLHTLPNLFSQVGSLLGLIGSVLAPLTLIMPTGHGRAVQAPPQAWSGDPSAGHRGGE